MRARRYLIFLVAFNLTTQMAVGRSATPDVWTVAGNGLPGLADGSARHAEFLFPSGVAVQKSDGTIYISDEAAQRIRMITSSGEVRTIAGSGRLERGRLGVAGGYVDGPARQAKFDRPAGLAIGPDDALYIADSRNESVRRLLHGTVSTVISNATLAQAGNVAAHLDNPRGLAFDRKGNLYIADDGAGLLRLDANGTLEPVLLKSTSEKRWHSVAYGETKGNGVVLVSSQTSVVAYHPSTGSDEVVYPTLHTEGLRPFGEPNQLVAIDARQFLFTDVNSEVVRYLRLQSLPFISTPFTLPIAGKDYGRPIDGAGYRDGPREDARFYAPMGIALNGSVAYIADAGNRRIRKIALGYFRVSEVGLDTSALQDKNHYNIALIGASNTFWGQSRRRLHLRQSGTHTQRFRPFPQAYSLPIRADRWGDPPSNRQLYGKRPCLEGMDAVIMDLLSPELDSVEPMSVIDRAAELRSNVADILKSVAVQHISLAIIWDYYAQDVSLAEQVIQALEYRDSFFVTYSGHDHHAALQYAAALKGLPVVQYDLYSDFVRYESGKSPPPLWDPIDHHENPRGAAFVGKDIGLGLLSAGFPHR